MDPNGLPEINTHVDIALASGTVFPSRIEGISGDTLQLAAPHVSRSVVEPDAALELAWLRDGGRVAVPARFTGLTGDHPACWEVKVLGAARRQSRRGYVRGGGGEQIELARPGEDRLSADGVVIDIGEASVRARLRMCDFQPGDHVDMTVHIGSDTVAVGGPVLDVRHLKETGHFDIIVAFDATEAQGRLIRGYILRQQLEQRRRQA